MSNDQSIVDNLRWARKTITGIQLQLHGFEEIPPEDVNYATRQMAEGLFFAEKRLEEIERQLLGSAQTFEPSDFEED